MPIATVLDEKPNLSEVKPIIESSTHRSYRAYVEAGFEKDIPHSVAAQYQRETKFLAAVSKDTIPTRKITRMVRRKENGKEYFIFTENWYATDWVGRQIPPVTDRTEGIVQLPNVTPTIDEQGRRIGKDLNGSITKYEMEFSKAEVDKWLEETGTDIDSVIFTVRSEKRRDNCTYDQFTTTTWIQANEIMMKDGGFEMDYVERMKDKKKA